MKGLAAILIASLSLYAQDADIKGYMDALAKEAAKAEKEFKGFSAERGKEIFSSKHIGKKGKEISCVSCHGGDLAKNGENVFTGKVIEPLSPKANPKRISSVKEVQKWLRRNFMDVYNREGTAMEKGDVLMHIMNN